MKWHFSRRLIGIWIFAAGLLGILANIIGVWSARDFFFPPEAMFVGVDLLEDASIPAARCSSSACGIEHAGTTLDGHFEPVFHLAVGSREVKCIAFGVSVNNLSDLPLENVSVSVALESESKDTPVSFCTNYDMSYEAKFPDSSLSRTFRNMNGFADVNYSISKIGPNDIAFLTVPIKLDANFSLSVENGSVTFQGHPFMLSISASAANVEVRTLRGFVYIEAVQDISQAIVDDGYLWGYHSTNFSNAIYSKSTNRLIDGIKSLVSSQPDYTEYVLSYYDLSSGLLKSTGYGVPNPPIQKNVIQTPKSDNHLIKVSVAEYKYDKMDICRTIVQPIEGGSYTCSDDFIDN